MSEEVEAVQEKKFGFLLMAFLFGLLIAAIPAFYMGYSRGKIAVQVEAVGSNHGRYKIMDNLGNTEFEWVPVEKR